MGIDDMHLVQQVTSPSQIDWAKLTEDMGYKRPLAFIKIGDKEMVLVHASIMDKAKKVQLKTPFPLAPSILDMVKVAACREAERSSWVAWAKAVKESPWPQQMCDGGLIEVVLPKV